VRRDADVPPPVPLCEVLYGHFREYMAICHEISDLERSRGWAEAKVWTPTVGMGNEAVIIAESSTLAGFEEERKARYADPDYMKLVRRAGELCRQGSIHDEFLEEAPQLA
jgi:hypothetical protein